MSLDQELLDLISETREVVIETRDASRTFRTVIWVAVDGGDIFVRSVRGDEGRWYQRALQDPDVMLDIAEYRVPFRAETASDDVSVEAASRALRRKYPKSGSLDSMLRDEVLHTTMRLVTGS